jgi:hypothetical protein
MGVVGAVFSFASVLVIGHLSVRSLAALVLATTAGMLFAAGEVQR